MVESIGASYDVADVMEIDSVDREFDREIDQQIKDYLSSPVFSCRVFHYSHDCRSYEVQIIHNPDRLELKIGETTSSAACMITSKGTVPEKLMLHWQRLVASTVQETVPCFIGNQTLSVDFPKATPQAAFSPTADQVIKNCFSSDQFVNTVVAYPFEGRTYTLRIIHNPAQAELVADNIEISFSWDFAILSDGYVPYQLLDHLQALFQNRWNENARVYIANQSNFFSEGEYRSGIEVLKSLRPVRIHKDGEFDLELDQQIRELFQSKAFTNTTLSYNFNNKNYNIRIIHNPEREDVKVRESFLWNTKYAIFSLERAPDALIKHIQGLIDSLSWWDYFFNIDTRFFSIDIKGRSAWFLGFAGLKVEPKS